jgi:hypothetical protein
MAGLGLARMGKRSEGRQSERGATIVVAPLSFRLRFLPR